MKPIYRPPKPSQASANTLCQKCLKRDNYECTTSLQDRPYKSRPSRTQQLLNPKLAPKLLSDEPNELLNKKGIADEVLAKKETERASNYDAMTSSQKRSRSLSTSSMNSVSTISTNARRSPSPRRSPTPPHRNHLRLEREDDMKAEPSRKRHRRSVSSTSVSSHGTYRNRSRHTRRRYSSFSPGERGRRRSRSIDMEIRGSCSRSRSSRMHSSRDRNRAGHRRDLRSPRRRSRDRRRRSRSRSHGPPRHERRRSPRRRDEEKRHGYGKSYQDDDRAGYRHRNGRWDNTTKDAPPRAQEPKERSLSPYSKRAAMTQAMSMGR